MSYKIYFDILDFLEVVTFTNTPTHFPFESVMYLFLSSASIRFDLSHVFNDIKNW